MAPVEINSLTAKNLTEEKRTKQEENDKKIALKMKKKGLNKRKVTRK